MTNAWELGDIITINTSQMWNISINSSDYVYATVVHTGEDIILQSGMLLGDESGTVVPSLPPSPPALQWAVFTPTTVRDTSGGSATVAQVQTDGDGQFTVYNLPRQGTVDETVFQQFNFTPGLAYSPTMVLIRIDHRDTNSARNQKLEVWEEDASVWRNEPIPRRNNWRLDEVDVSSYIDTQNDINNLKVRYLARSTINNRDANIEYMAVYVEWWQ
ncbi:MAG: hypothetical protein M8352_05650 [ANME-2 cluster archaeon]|nr:hypothetical protein [ANME-2 cluster archaeon]